MSRWGGVAALLFGLAAVGGLSAIQPQSADHSWHAATVPDTADAGGFRVTIADPSEDVIIVTGVQRGMRQYETTHKLVLMIVRYDFLAFDQRINDVNLVTADGYRYEALDDYDNTITNLDPGFTTEGIVVFEVPEDKLNGASVEFCRAMIVRERVPCARLDGVVTEQTRRQDGWVTIDPAELTYEVIE